MYRSSASSNIMKKSNARTSMVLFKTRVNFWICRLFNVFTSPSVDASLDRRAGKYKALTKRSMTKGWLLSNFETSSIVHSWSSRWWLARRAKAGNDSSGSLSKPSSWISARCRWLIDQGIKLLKKPRLGPDAERNIEEKAGVDRRLLRKREANGGTAADISFIVVVMTIPGLSSGRTVWVFGELGVRYIPKIDFSSCYVTLTLPSLDQL